MHPATDSFDKLSNRLQAAFIRLAKDEHLWSGDLYSALRNVTTTLAEVLEVGRASVWRMSPDRQELVCQLLFRTDRQGFESGASLPAAQFPHYFGVLDEERLLDVPDAANDQRVQERYPGHLRPLGIGACLEATLHEAGQLAGVLCLEHLGSPRLWSRDEQLLAISVADLLSQLQVFHTLKDRERSYRSIFDAAGDAILTIVDGLIADCNPQAQLMLGRPRAELIGKPVTDFSPDIQGDGRRSDDKAEGLLQAAIDVGPQQYEWTHRRADGSRIETEVSLSAIWLAGRCQVTAIVRDVTERRLAEQIRQTSAELLKQRNLALQVVLNLASQLHRSSDSEAIADETLRVLQLLQRAPLSLFHLADEDGEHFEVIASTGYTPAQIAARRRMPIERSLSGQALALGQILHCTNVEDDERIDPAIRERSLIDGIHSFTVLPLVYQDKQLGVIGLQFYDCGNEFSDAELEILRAVSQTVSLALANARSVQALEFQATHDSLTGLPNRTQLHRDATESLRWIAGSPRQLALMLLDLDRFKEVNDTLGHRTGDQLLKLVATRLQAAIEREDAMLARLGGDEFAILLRSVTDADQAQNIARSIVAALRTPIEVEGIFIELGASIGVAVYPQHGGTSHALLRCADVAMYAAKGNASSVSLYDNSHDAHNPRRLAMITELGSAIRSEQLVLHYQPRYSLQEGRWCSCEALVRWQHPKLGFIPPGEFVQFAETSELIRPLTLWVARTAVRQLALWQQTGLCISTSINLSTRNLLDITLPEALAELLREYGLQPGSLELEITETALMTDPDRAMQTIERLAELGMRLSIDDFGTGYSSLAYLKRMPLHALKIDRSFVRDMLHDDQDAIIVRSTIGLAHSLGLQVVAEGVEDPATLSRLREYGCDEAQGYVLSKPMAHAAALRVMQAPLPIQTG
ncbi:bifunctional diguanylate cyclase/phosphodiesterase [Uliginosibacterium aquaticum]|uniref:EAL domain-containing protein n=1 Tax=Uliginosibacterium aquaticum TaxID=2731212 RepID=A0ABX2IBC8_9RHOO|nr:EAL domain-containing protein [Uliginosibacterium aquaticum]NSL53699.1 EAL domain-containing protein [Uliginosibacterium aquaticum]